jgi:hypothetical protein
VLRAESQDCLRTYRQCVEGSTAVASRLLHSGDRSRTPAFKHFPAAKCFPANARGLASSLLATEIVWISLSTERGDQTKNPHGFANSDWPYKCYLAMSEPIADRAVRLMKDKDLWS